MTQFNWIIKHTPTYSIETQTDIVSQIYWQCQAISENGATNSFGCVNIIHNHESIFIPYSELTEEQVWSWVNPQINREEIESNLQTMIDTQKSPANVSQSLPWVLE
jgi:hypothetical protein